MYLFADGNPQPGPKFDYKLAWFERLIAHSADLLAAPGQLHSKTNRAACRERGIVPVIPHRSNTKHRPALKLLYKGRARTDGGKDAGLDRFLACPLFADLSG